MMETMKKTKKKPGYKKTKISYIPEGWKLTQLGKVVKTFSGGTPSRNNPEFFNGKIPWIKSGELNKRIIYETEERISEKGLINSSAKWVKKDTLLLALYGATAGLPALTKIPATISQAILAIVPNSGVHKLFLLFWFENNKEKIVKKYTQGGQPNLSAGIINSLIIILPPLSEQKKIAEILSTWDAAIEKTRALIAAKEKRKKALMQQLVTGKRRFREFEGEEWKEIALNDFLIPTLREVDKPTSNYMALGIRSHGKGTFLKPNSDPTQNVMEKLFVVHKNDLIVNITFAWEGAIAVANTEDHGALVSHRFPTYTFRTNIAIPEFFRYVILQKRFRYILGLISPGGAGRNRVLSKKDFLKIKWELPSVTEQQKIATVLQTADREIELLKQKLDTLQRQKKGLMQKLLTGQVRVKVVSPGVHARD